MTRAENKQKAEKNKQNIIKFLLQNKDWTLTKDGDIKGCPCVNCNDCAVKDLCDAGGDAATDNQLRRWLEEHLIVI